MVYMPKKRSLEVLIEIVKDLWDGKKKPTIFH